MVTRIVLADDHPTLLRGLASLFDGEDFLVAGTAGTSDRLVELVTAEHPEVAITDLSMPGDIFEAIAKIVALACRVIVFTAYPNPKLAFQALQAGALGFVLKGRPAEDLFEALRETQNGKVFVSPELAPRILSLVRAQDDADEAGQQARKFSLRERQIVDGLLRAKTNKEIARELNLSEKTIKHYMTNLMGKLGAKNRLDVVLAVQATPTLMPEPAGDLGER